MKQYEPCPVCERSAVEAENVSRYIGDLRDAFRYRAVRYAILNNIEPDDHVVPDTDAPMSAQIAEFDGLVDSLRKKVDAQRSAEVKL